MPLASDLYRVTWFWEAMGRGGSETMMLRRQQSSTGAVLDGLKPFLLKRAALLGNQGTLRACRCSTYTDPTGARVKNLSELRYFSYPGQQTVTNNDGNSGPNPGENLAQSLQLMCYAPAPSGRKKIIYLGYPWEIILPGNQKYEPVGSWTTNYNSFITDLVEGGWGWIAHERSIPYAITNYVQNPTTGKVLITVAAPPGWTIPGPAVEVHLAFAGKNPLDGRQLVQPISATTCETVASIGVRDFAMTAGGKLRLYDPFFVSLNPGWPAITNVGRIGVVQPVRRARGKPMPLTPGRSPNATRW